MGSFLKKAWIACALLLLAGCSSGSLQAELEQLQAETTRLSEQLSAAEEDLTAAYDKIEELEEERKTGAEPEPVQSVIAPPPRRLPSGPDGRMVLYGISGKLDR